MRYHGRQNILLFNFGFRYDLYEIQIYCKGCSYFVKNDILEYVENDILGYVCLIYQIKGNIANEIIYLIPYLVQDKIRRNILFNFF